MIFCVLYEAPIALKSHGIFSGKKVTSHPSVDKQLKEAGKPMFFNSYSHFFAVFLQPVFDCRQFFDTFCGERAA